MISYEAAVLEVLGEAKSSLGWYQIEVRLSSIELAERFVLPEVLTRLVERGLVACSEHDDSPTHRYALTEAGAQSARRSG